MSVTCSHIVQTTSDKGMQTSFGDHDFIHTYTYEQKLCFLCMYQDEKTYCIYFTGSKRTYVRQEI